jgi:hypothetical protein
VKRTHNTDHLEPETRSQEQFLTFRHQVLRFSDGCVLCDVKTKKAFPDLSGRLSVVKLAATYSPTFCSAVPSAQEGLTSLFGMGRGGTPPL